jgi:hypothetical protein
VWSHKLDMDWENYSVLGWRGGRKKKEQNETEKDFEINELMQEQSFKDRIHRSVLRRLISELGKLLCLGAEEESEFRI